MTLKFSSDVFSDAELFSLYQTLKDSYKNHNLEIDPSYHRNKDLGFLKYFSTNRLSKPNLQIYIFLVLFSHNTSDRYTYKQFLKICDLLEKKVEFSFYDLFYKKKKEYSIALETICKYIRSCEEKNVSIDFLELTKIPYVGLKSAAIIYNHVSECVYPIVDVNVEKCFNIITCNNFNANIIHKILSRLPDLIGDDYCAYDLICWLWTHRKFCRSKNPLCNSKLKNYQICDECIFLRNKYINVQSKC